MHAVGDVGPQIAGHTALDRTHIGDDGALCQTRRHGLAYGAIAAQVGADDDQIGAGDGFGGVLVHGLDDAQLHGLVPGGLAAGAADDAVHQSGPLGGQSDGRSDQTNADQGQAFEMGCFGVRGHSQYSKIHPRFP